MKFVLGSKVFHVLYLNPTCLTAVLHELLEVSLNLIGSVECAVSVLREQAEACHFLKITQLSVSDTLDKSYLRIILFESLGVCHTFLGKQVGRSKLKISYHITHHELWVI